MAKSPPSRSHGRLSIEASAEPRSLIRNTPRQAGAWQARVLTLYPEMFPGTLGQSVLGNALKEGRWTLDVVDIRRFARDRHRTVDAPPAGGGPGMVLKPEILGRAIEATATQTPDPLPLLALSPRGTPFTQARAAALAKGRGVTLIAGRFEGIDQRVLDHYGVEEISIGDYVLTGGEVAAQVLIDACVRLIPRVLGNAESALEESFSDGLLEHPQYTKPADWNGRAIPEILLSGHHAKIAEWRTQQSRRLTKERRPDLWRAHLEADGDPDGDQELSDAQTTADKAGKEGRLK